MTICTGMSGFVRIFLSRFDVAEQQRGSFVGREPACETDSECFRVEHF